MIRTVTLAVTALYRGYSDNYLQDLTNYPPFSGHVSGYLDTNNSKTVGTQLHCYLYLSCELLGPIQWLGKQVKKLFIQLSVLLIIIKQQLVILHSENFMTAVI